MYNLPSDTKRRCYFPISDIVTTFTTHDAAQVLRPASWPLFCVDDNNKDKRTKPITCAGCKYSTRHCLGEHILSPPFHEASTNIMCLLSSVLMCLGRFDTPFTYNSFLHSHVSILALCLGDIPQGDNYIICRCVFFVWT